MASKVINKQLSSNNVITCDNLTVFVGKKKVALIENFSFAFKKQKIYAIIGNSGVGKTTLVSYFNGLIRTRDGNIYVNNQFIDGKKRKFRNYKEIRKDVGLVFQFPETQIFKDTVEKDIAFGPINNSVNKAKVYELVSKYMYLVGLDKNLLKANPFDLSNGQKRLVAIAGVLAIEPKVVILDEPTAGLDPYYQKKIKSLIKILKRQGKTIILITHDMDSVLELSDEVLVLHNKKLAMNGAPYVVFNNISLMKQMEIQQPNVINVVNKLIKVNKKYSKLIKQKPRTLEELSTLIKKGGK